MKRLYTRAETLDKMGGIKIWIVNYGLPSNEMIKSASPDLSFLVPPGSVLEVPLLLLVPDPSLLKLDGATALKKMLRRIMKKFMIDQNCLSEQKEENLDSKVGTRKPSKKDRNPEFNTCRLNAKSLLLLTFYREQVNELTEP